ncbi:MAG: bifunctional hydroxymethylpyrimidine kinase/phosphomethylpyrimidine kinase, partial [Myxococcales bacterium]
MSAPAVLVLAGLDPSGGAGLLADAEAIRAMGAAPLCVATALTVQTRRAARRYEAVNPDLIA